MNAHNQRVFTATDAVREQVPLLVGLTGPSGSGKTFTALRMATGIQEVTGGDIYFIDTESRRALHYATMFKFKHVEFAAPFGSLDYLAALQWCVKQGAGVIVVDSMSHEHEGPGGMIDAHEQALTRMAGDDYAKRERMTMLAWQKPKAARRSLINGILQLNSNFVFCFRAKSTSKPMKVDGKNKIVPMGYMPIAGEEFLFEQTLNALLLPGAQGVPTWHSENPGESAMIKLPEQFKSLAEPPPFPLDEKVGKRLAMWAKGGATLKRPAAVPQTEARPWEQNDGELAAQDRPSEPSPAASLPAVSDVATADATPAGSEAAGSEWEAWLSTFEENINYCGSVTAADRLWVTERKMTKGMPASVLRQATALVDAAHARISSEQGA